MARPIKYTPELLAEVESKIIEYTEGTELPSVAECAYKLGIVREQMYEYPELSYALKRLITKKEWKLEERMYTGKSPVAACIFALKNIGWRDNLELSGANGAPLITEIKVLFIGNSRISDPTIIPDIESTGTIQSPEGGEGSGKVAQCSENASNSLDKKETKDTLCEGNTEKH